MASSLESTGTFVPWWLRSAYAGATTYAGSVSNTGSIGNNNVYREQGARPAANLNLSQVVFTTDTAYKTSSPNKVLPTALIQNPNQTYTATIYNKDLDNLEVTTSHDIKASRKETLSIGYSGAQQGDNDVIAALIKDAQGKVLYYGNLTQANESGKAEVEVPEDLPNGTYSLTLHNVQDNNFQDATGNQGMLTNLSGRIAEKNTVSLNLGGGASIPIEDATVAPIEDAVYTGSPITPLPTPTLDGIVLQKDVDYTLQYMNNIEPGEATILVVGIGQYQGVKVIKFTIKDTNMPEVRPGWNFNEEGGWYYVNPQGFRITDGWHWIEDVEFGAHWYYFSETGYIKTNQWIFTDAWYYVNSSGAMNVGTWNFINGAWYGFNWNGTMCTGWTYDSGYHNWFYCDPSSGAMRTNCWSFINGAWYGFWANGEMCRGWVWDSGYRAWFYCSPSDGHMYTNGWYRIDNKSYYFNASGKLV